MSRRSLRMVALVTGAVVLAGAGVAGFRILDKPEKAAAADGPSPAQTVEIVRTDLSQAKDLTGQLGYGAGQTIKSHATGTLTWLPKVGAALDRGEVLFRVDNKPIVLFYGSTPLFRKLDKPIDGPDVRVLKQNLTALGFLPETTTDKLTPATTWAVKEWQKSLELDPTGVLDPASVVVLPGPVRIDALKAASGDPAAADVLGVTSTDKVVTLPVDADSVEGIAAGGKVKLTLPNGKVTGGTIRSVGTDAAPPPSDGNPADGDKKPQVNALITLDQQAASAGVDSGPVTVTVPGPARKGVLVVPVAALLALREGGYAVQVAGGNGTALVAVKTGMFADGNVEITGAGLQAGQKVVTTS
ncbi:peptidoglycan-binding protein [Kribbella sp. NPDC056861]|uniref:peptidoglycan-binding protein n=1 Tax=Kribbella sp. NPDC056861 TaxID=3154857 RepID=UPI00344A6B0E